GTPNGLYPELPENEPPPISETRPAESAIDSHPDTVEFQSLQNLNLPKPSPEKERPPTDPIRVDGQNDFDDSIAQNLYSVVLAMHRKHGHAPSIESAKAETWGQHIKRLRIEDCHPEELIRDVLG